MQKVIELSEEKVTELSKYVEDNPIEIYIDYNDELSNDQVDQILEGKADEVKWEIEDNACHYDDGEYYWDELKKELDITEEQLDMWRYSIEGFCPSHQLTDSSWSHLLGNTSVNITATLWDVDWNFSNWAYGGTVNYSDVKDALKVLGVNPLEFKKLKAGGSMSGGDELKGYFPDMPKREAKIDTKELWENMCVLYDGVMNFCLGDLEEVMEVISSDSKDIIFKKGTNVVMYDFNNGAGITTVELTGDVTIPRKMVTFRNDGSSRYGIQECYGFVNSYWQEGGIKNGK